MKVMLFVGLISYVSIALSVPTVDDLLPSTLKPEVLTKLLQIDDIIVRQLVKKRLEKALAFVLFNRGGEVSFSNIPIGPHIDRVMDAVVAFEQMEAPVNRLSMSHCRLQKMPHSLDLLETLVLLDISDNAITGPLYPSGPPSLEVLYAFQNRFDGISDDFYRVNRNLKILDVKKNKIGILSSFVCRLSNLYHLDVSDNFLTTLPHTLSLLSDLRFLNIKKNYINTDKCSALSELLASERKCMIFGIDDQRLIIKSKASRNDELPSLLKQSVLKKIAQIGSAMVRNRVKEKLENALSIAAFTRGAEVSLNTIQIGSDIDAVMGALVAFDQIEAPITVLSMAHCMIPKVSHLLALLRSVWFLDLSDNAITGRVHFFGPDSLQELYFAYNKIGEFTSEWHAALPQLKFLDVRNNRIKNVSVLQELMREGNCMVVGLDEQLSGARSKKKTSLKKKKPLVQGVLAARGF